MSDGALYDSVKALNDAYRTALMNRKYYGYRLSRLRTVSRAMDIVIAVGTSSAIAAWAIWKSTSAGENAWAVLAGLATLFAVVKPILNPSKDVDRYTKLFVGHGDVAYDLETIVRKLGRVGSYTDEMQVAFERAHARIKELAPDDDPKVDKKLLRRCFAEVRAEKPVDSLWWPV
ncbi:MAG: hypothetical protein QUS33_04730 [Dehalococcoidia bacterium]|nr:hypothetical protein [Dehalococcoidia bacterium]